MPLLSKYKQGDLGQEDETRLTGRSKPESWVKKDLNQGNTTSVDGGNLKGMKKSQVDSNFNALADKKDY